MKKWYLALAFFVCSSSLQTKENKFEAFGDLFRLMPLYVAIATISLQDWKGLLQLSLGTLATQLTTEGIKSLDAWYARQGNQSSMMWARRPGSNDFKGMPSGHSAGAFSGAAFVYYRYGWKAAVAPIVLATLTAASRVQAKKHSILQVSIGAGIAWGFAYLFTAPYQSNFWISPIFEKDSQGGDKMGVNLSYRF
ncbi:phosphatase PAP2 family protein [Helicobacter kayseriensis]|uniref:phosphatase PAP2 family protein n=1 Tax=Helicobacter kayseriensis TaxID=2905877 RepID=UPI001E379CBB|nr:phosphatase PAP2 family protein [Helicobacter kayseriensis]MCE3047754.1 phosphatase PAP2 family protein [Helicobacter kayseriensis]MCE3049147.1 phosphatase PAP2 family protein [Helicobacter kayseriensis]